MLKKCLLLSTTIATLTCSGFTLANSLYVGAGLGGTGVHSQVTQTGIGAGTYDDGNIGVIGGIYGGYMFNFANKFNLGFEAFGNATSAEFKESTTGTVTKTEYNYNYGIRALPGIQIAPALALHALIGYAVGNFKITDSNSGLNTTFNPSGYQLGLGGTTHLSENLLLRGDVIYTGYASETVTANNGNTFKNEANTWDGIVSLAYLFG